MLWAVAVDGMRARVMGLCVRGEIRMVRFIFAFGVFAIGDNGAGTLNCSSFDGVMLLRTCCGVFASGDELDVFACR